MPDTLVIATAAITEGDVQHAIWTKVERATVVIKLGLIDTQQLSDAGRIDHRGWIAGVGDLPFANHGLVVRRNARRQGGKISYARYRLPNINVKQTVSGVLRMKGYT